MKQTLAISLDEALIQKATFIAASHATTVSQLLSEELTRLINQLAANHYEQTKQHAFAQMEIGCHLGGMYLPREECHER